MEDCIFDKIVRGELPSYKIYEDDKFMSFLDIHPRTRGHALVIPKKHYQWVYDVPEFGEYWEVALKVTKAQLKALNAEFISYVTYGLDVPHAHIHVIPRYKEKELVPGIIKVPPDEMKVITEKLKKELI
ncbi:MAG: HIT domain-containing protein [Candidatus Roizmanbacteria bacterium]|nr:MAG: HIT domain-containing protein [Candidatus Roizmanbacteria bacterium]